MIRFLAAAILALASTNAFGAGLECGKVGPLATAAASYRDQGLTQEQLRYPLPPRQYLAGDPGNPKAATLHFMHEVVDELYLAPELDSNLYVIFKTEQCRLRASSPELARDFQAALSDLKSCGSLQSAGRASCVAKAAVASNSANGP